MKVTAASSSATGGTSSLQVEHFVEMDEQYTQKEPSSEDNNSLHCISEKNQNPNINKLAETYNLSCQY